MKIRTFVIGYVLALALLVFANRRSEVAPSSTFRSVVDLTSTATAQENPQRSTFRHKDRKDFGDTTQIEAPASYSPKLWSVDQIPGERLVAPLAIVSANGSSAVSMQDVVRYEQNHGEIPPGAVVLARTQQDIDGAKVSFADDTVKFLVHARNVIGLGIEAERAKNSESDNYALSHSAYLLSKVANLEKVPASGSMVMVAPPKLRGAATGPVRVLALVR